MRVHVGIGGNLGDVQTTIRRAIAALAAITGARSVEVSSIWTTAPVGPVAQDDFLNACAVLEVGDEVRPRQLMASLLETEAGLGRDRRRERPQGPRPIDLDLLLFGDLVLDDKGPPRVTIPHPRLAKRAFALAPLVEIAGEDLIIPGAGRAGDLLAEALRDERQVIRKLSPG